MPNTKSVLDDVSLIDFIHKRARESAYVNVRTYGAITKGLKGEEITEMGLLKEAGAVGFTDDGLPVMNAGVMRKALAYAKELGVPVAQHAEDLHLSCGSCMNEGAISAKLGVVGAPNAAEAVMVERDILLAELTGAQYHVLHISTAEAIDAVRRALPTARVGGAGLGGHRGTMDARLLRALPARDQLRQRQGRHAAGFCRVPREGRACLHQ